MYYNNFSAFLYSMVFKQRGKKCKNSSKTLFASHYCIPGTPPHIHSTDYTPSVSLNDSWGLTDHRTQQKHRHHHHRRRWRQQVAEWVGFFERSHCDLADIRAAGQNTWHRYKHDRSSKTAPSTATNNPQLTLPGTCLYSPMLVSWL